MHIKILAPAAVIGIALSGCMGGGGMDADNNRSLDSVHQPIVSISNFVFDADASGGNLSPVELRRVSDWLDAMHVEYGDRVAIDDASGGVPRPARDAIAMLMARRGMMLSDYAPITAGAIEPGRVRVVLTRSVARVDGCPNWDTRTATGTANLTSSNYGCASNANLAAMVADATDLVRGQNRASNDPLTASKAINAYRTAPPTGAGGLSGSSGSSNQSGGGGQ